MKKGLLLCSGGMSTTLIAKVLNDLFLGKMTWDAKGASSSSAYKDTLSDYDFVFVSPQIRYMFDDISLECEVNDVICAQIKPEQYIVTKANELAEIVKSKLF